METINGDQGLLINPDLCSTCRTMMSDISTGDFQNKWRVEHKKRQAIWGFKHHEQGYFQRLKAPCCLLCEIIVHAIWNRFNPCALHATKSWDLWMYLEETSQTNSPLEDVTLISHPGRIQDWGSDEYWTAASLLEFVQVSKGASATEQDILPDLPQGLPCNEIRGWIAACMDRRDGHEDCHRQPPILPTRVVDVASSPPKVVLSHGKSEPYVALSHCWGGAIKAMLLHETAPEFCTTGIPDSILPATFRDAIAVTQQLGFRWLWIDALCIIQDDESDWTREALLMQHVYERASLVLSAYSTPNSEAGLRFCRSARVASSADGDLYAQRGCLAQHDTDAPLGSRGWTLQEHVLAFSILYVGRGLVEWVCPGGRYSEGGEGLLQAKDKHSVLNLNYLNVGEGFPTQEQAWRHVVRHYSSRRLSFGKDKLAALAGVAEKFEAGLVGFESASAEKTYLVGLWKESLLGDLMWATLPLAVVTPQPSRAPSWSWAGWDGPVDWRIFSRVEQGDNFKACCEIDLAAVEVSDENKAARQASGRLVVSGLLVFVSSGPLKRPSGVSALPRKEHEPMAIVSDYENMLDEAVMTALRGEPGTRVRTFRDIYGIIDRDSKGPCFALKLCSSQTRRGSDIETVFMLLEQVRDEGDHDIENVFRRVGLVAVKVDLLNGKPDAAPIYLEDDPIGWPGDVRKVTII